MTDVVPINSRARRMRDQTRHHSIMPPVKPVRRIVTMAKLGLALAARGRRFVWWRPQRRRQPLLVYGDVAAVRGAR